ncbi:MAG: FAD:protein FMN transferase [Gammaproteobacteria bacterium]
MRFAQRIVLCVLTLSVANVAAAEWVSGEAAIMGTSIRVELWEPESGAGDALIDAVMDEMHRIDYLMSTYKPTSKVSDVNARAAKSPVVLDDELYELIQRALSFSDLTDGAFDITYESVGQYYDYRKGMRPDDATRLEAARAIDFRNVVLDGSTREIRFARDGVKINLGGVAKGYAVENAVKILRKRGVTSAIVTAGGDSRILGDRRGRPWTVGIRDPRDRDGLITRIPLQDEAISTSGDYERFFESDGVRHHHILKPDTGDSARALRSVTIIGADATMTDALSTGVFVLGREKGLALIERLEDFEAVIIDKSGALHYSSGLTPGG